MMKKELKKGDCLVTKIFGTPSAFYEVIDVKEDKIKMALISETQEHWYNKSILWFPIEYVDSHVKPIASRFAKKRYAQASIIMSGYYVNFLSRLDKIQKWESTDLKVGDVILYEKKKEKAYCKVTAVDPEKSTYSVTMVGVEDPSRNERRLYNEATMTDDLRPGQVFVHIPNDILDTQLFFFECMERNLRDALGLLDCDVWL